MSGSKLPSSWFKVVWRELICQASKQRHWWLCQLVVIILDLSHAIVWLVRHMCWIFFFAKEDHFLMLFQMCTKPMFGQSDLLVITVIAWNRINSVGPLFFCDRTLSFSKNMPYSLKRFLSNFNVVAIQNSLDGFCNTPNVRNNSKTSSVTGFWSLWKKVLV